MVEITLTSHRKKVDFDTEEYRLEKDITIFRRCSLETTNMSLVWSGEFVNENKRSKKWFFKNVFSIWYLKLFSEIRLALTSQIMEKGASKETQGDIS